MDIFSPFHLIIILLLVVLLFGTSKLKNIGPDIGNAVRGFKKAMHGDDEVDKAKADAAQKLQADPPSSGVGSKQEAGSTESK